MDLLLEGSGADAEDVFLELGGVKLATQYVGGLEQVSLELGEREWHVAGPFCSW